MVQVAGLGVRSLFLSFVFSFFSSSPIHASIACVGVNGFTFLPNPFVLRSFLLVSFLGVVG